MSELENVFMFYNWTAAFMFDVIWKLLNKQISLWHLLLNKNILVV